MSTQYRRGLYLTLGLYVALYAGLLSLTGGLPYVMDNNESFSSFVHASNLYHFPFSRSFGLTDEAFSPSPEAHPYVYTHQGNFPRLYAFVLYALGARTVESHIVITTFTVGIVAVFLLYHYFTLVAAPSFAFIAAAVAMSDYVFFMQWHVNTFRVWHCLFLFLALLCVHGIGGAHRRRWLLTTIAGFASLFYFELAFAVFVAAMTGLYAGFRLFRRPRLLALFWGAQCAGLAIAVLVLASQLIAYLGWSDFLLDLQYTYNARNLVSADPAYADRIHEFVTTRQLAFWFNFATQQFSRSPSEILASIATGYFNIYTPTLWNLVSVVLMGWLAAMGCRSAGSVTQSSSLSAWRGFHATMATLLLIICWTRFLLAMADDDWLVGAGGASISVSGIRYEAGLAVAFILAAGLTGAVSRFASGSWWPTNRSSPLLLTVAAIVMLLTEHVLLGTSGFFVRYYAPFWLQVHGIWFSGWVVQLMTAAASVVSVALILQSRAERDPAWGDLARYLVCGLAAYCIVYTISPGYIRSGYLTRSAPFLSFILETAIALVFWCCWRIARRGISVLRVHETNREGMHVRHDKPALVSRMAAFSVAAGSATLLLLLPAFWISLQAHLTRLLPPTHFTFVKQLAAQPFKHASFSANTYAAPIFVNTGEWAYFDTRLASPDGGLVKSTSQGSVVDSDRESYLWLADRARNSAYLRPSYFLCFTYQDLGMAVRRLQGSEEGCASAGIVKYADAGEPRSIGTKVVARDPRPEMSWAIVSLDWTVLDNAHPRSE